MTDLTDVVASAVDDATSGVDDSAATSTPADSPAAASAASAAVAPPDESVPPTDPPVDEVEAELAAQGIKPPIEGQRENRIPYTRVQKILANARKKLTEAHEATLKAEREKMTPVQQAAERFHALNRLATENPRAYLEILAKANPAYQEFLRTHIATPETPKPAAPVTDPEPQPDVAFQDGTKGYSPEQHAKLMDWHSRKAEERATAAVRAEYEKRFGPIEQDWRARKQQEAILPRVQEQRRAMEETWGADLIKTHEAELVAALKANPTVPAERVVASVLVGKLRADRTKIRGEVMKEMSHRSAAAQRTAPAPAATPTVAGPRSLEDVVRESVSSLR